MVGLCMLSRLQIHLWKTVSGISDLYLQLYNFRLLLTSTRYHVDRVWYWLTEARGRGLPIPEKVYMVPSRPKWKVYNCFIKLFGILHEICLNHKKTVHGVVSGKQNPARNEVRILWRHKKMHIKFASLSKKLTRKPAFSLWHHRDTE